MTTTFCCACPTMVERACALTVALHVVSESGIVTRSTAWPFASVTTDGNHTAVSGKYLRALSAPPSLSAPP